MIVVTWKDVWFWEFEYDGPGPERREAYGDWRQLTIGPLEIYWQEDRCED